MKEAEIEKFMSFNKEGKLTKPLKVFLPEEKIMVGVYQGSFSEYDLLVKYRQKDKNGKWTRIRTPKHIHWAVDLLIKMHADRRRLENSFTF